MVNWGMDKHGLVVAVFLLVLHLTTAQDEHEMLEIASYTTLDYNISLRTLENITGATYHRNYLLLYSTNLLTVIDLSKDVIEAQYKYLVGFNCKKLVSGFNEDQLFFLSHNKHCVREMQLSSRYNQTFSGSCEESGFVDGGRSDARFNKPLDVERVSEFDYYIADFNNDAIRAMNRDGEIRKILLIHAKPVALTGRLFVSAEQKIFKVLEDYDTYTVFIRDVNLAGMVSCSPKNLVILTKDYSLDVLPLTNDISLQAIHFHVNFSHVICRENNTVGIEFIRNPNDQTELDMIVRTINTTRATTIRLDSGYKDREDNSNIPTNLTTSAIKATESSKSQYTTTYAPKLAQSNTFHSKNYSTTSKTLDAEFSTSDWHPDITPEPLGNHAHQQFDHLPSGYREHNTSWEVIVSSLLAGLTCISIFAALVCVIQKRKLRVRIPKGSTTTTEGESTGAGSSETPFSHESSQSDRLIEFQDFPSEDFPQNYKDMSHGMSIV